MVAESTFHNWKLRHKGFSESVTRGKIEADGVIAQSLYHRAVGYTHKEEKVFQPGPADLSGL